MKKLCLMLMIYRALSYLYSKLKKASKTTFLAVMKVGEKLKNTLLDVAQNFDKMSDSEKAEANDNIRKQFDNIIHGNSPKTEREKEIDKLAREELSPEEQAEARENALKAYQNEELRKIQQRNSKPKPTPKAVRQEPEQPTLFDLGL